MLLSQRWGVVQGVAVSLFCCGTGRWDHVHCAVAEPDEGGGEVLGYLNASSQRKKNVITHITLLAKVPHQHHLFLS